MTAGRTLVMQSLLRDSKSCITEGHVCFLYLQIREELSRSLNDTMMKNYNYDAHLTTAIDDMQQRVII